MHRFLIVALLIYAIPWSIQTWWRMQKARGPRERALMSRHYLAGWMFGAVLIVLTMVLKGQTMLYAIPIIAAAGLAIQHGYKKALARIKAEEADPLSRARRIN
jgi:hypothetical protein